MIPVARPGAKIRIGTGTSLGNLPPSEGGREGWRDRARWRLGMVPPGPRWDERRAWPSTDYDLTGLVDWSEATDLPQDHVLRVETYQPRRFVDGAARDLVFTREAGAIGAPGLGLINEFNVGGCDDAPRGLLAADLNEDPDGWAARTSLDVERVGEAVAPFCHYGYRAFGHFVLDGLLQVYLNARQIEDGEVKLAYGPLPTPWMQDLLAVCGVGKNQSRILKRPVALLRDARISSAMAGHGVYFPGEYSKSFFAWLRARLVAGDLAAPGRDRVYIRRGQGSGRRIVNEPALEALLEENGFEIIDFAAMSVVEQARRIARAELLMSAWGSGLTLAPLLQGQRRVVELTPPALSDPWFLRQVAVHALHYMPISQAADAAGDMVVDLARISRIISRL